MRDEEKERRHSAPNDDLVTLEEAAFMVHLQSMGVDSTISDAQSDSIAKLLSGVVTLYSVSDDGTVIRALTRDDMQGGTSLAVPA